MRFLASFLMCIISFCIVGCNSDSYHSANQNTVPTASMSIYQKDPMCVFNCVDGMAPPSISDQFRNTWDGYRYCPDSTLVNESCIKSLREAHNLRQDIIQATLTDAVHNCCQLYCDNDPGANACFMDAFTKFFKDSWENQNDFLNAVAACCPANP